VYYSVHKLDKLLFWVSPAHKIHVTPNANRRGASDLSDLRSSSKAFALSRRKMVNQSLVASLALGTGILGSTKGAFAWDLPFSPDKPLTPFEQQLVDIYASGNVAPVLSQIVSFVTGPTAAALYASVLATSGNSLTNFQADLLQTFIDLSRYSSAVTTATSKTLAQKSSGLSGAGVRLLIDSHPSIQVLRAAGAQLKSSPQLASKVSDLTTSMQTAISADLSDPAISAAFNELANIASSTEFSNLHSQMSSILSSSELVKYLQSSDSPPELLLTLLPLSTLNNLQLPLSSDSDAPFGNFVFEVLLIGAIALAVLNTPVTVVALAASALAFLAGIIIVKLVINKLPTIVPPTEPPTEPPQPPTITVCPPGWSPGPGGQCFPST
jgi:hypothetical protein